MNEHNQKHLTLSNRTYIEQELLQKSTFSTIGSNLHKDLSTIAKESSLEMKLSEMLASSTYYDMYDYGAKAGNYFALTKRVYKKIIKKNSILPIRQISATKRKANPHKADWPDFASDELSFRLVINLQYRFYFLILNIPNDVFKLFTLPGKYRELPPVYYCNILRYKSSLALIYPANKPSIAERL